MKNKFQFLKDIPNSSKEEIFETLISNEKVKIERIISYAQTSPEGFWYDQDEDEFVMVVEGEAHIAYDEGELHKLQRGDALYIPAHQRHRVSYTSDPTVWLAVFI
jgi:cupin 2 domain-containing protein